MLRCSTADCKLTGGLCRRLPAAAGRSSNRNLMAPGLDRNSLRQVPWRKHFCGEDSSMISWRGSSHTCRMPTYTWAHVPKPGPNGKEFSGFESTFETKRRTVKRRRISEQHLAFAVVFETLRLLVGVCGWISSRQRRQWRCLSGCCWPESCWLQ